MKESKMELQCRKLAERMGYVVLKGSGMVGAPDKVYLRDGKGFVAEKKTLKGVQSAAQKRVQNLCENRGVPYYLIRTVEQFREVLLKHEE